ncbi:MAG: glycosyltransferase family 4 protein [Anaerolineae bacterium]
MNRVLIITEDIIGPNMAGPAVREWEMARTLSHHARVTLASPHPGDVPPQAFALRPHRSDPAQIQTLLESADVVLTTGYMLRKYPLLKTIPQPLGITLSHSFVLENLQQFSGRAPRERWAIFRDNAAALTDLLVAGDFFVCNSERQRDYWLGMLSALGRLNPATFSDDPSLRRLIDVAPFGIPTEPPQRTGPVLKGVRPGIAPGDTLIFWGGGIYPWLDALTAIRAMRLVAGQRPDVKLFFAGTKHPSPNVPPSPAVEAAMSLSRELGLTGSAVFFNDWIPYPERGAYLLEADLGLSLHRDHIETRYSFRTRFLDCIWAKLPLIATRGDVTADAISAHNLGHVVNYGQAEDVAQAILELAAQPEARAACRQNFGPLAERYRWANTLAPLVQFCRQPYKAADHRPGAAPFAAPAPAASAAAPARWRKAWQLLKSGGIAALGQEVVKFIRWRLRRA